MQYRIVPAHGYGYNLERLTNGHWTFIMTGTGRQLEHAMACLMEVN